ncbi:MAG: histidine phosphatase family protein [Cyanobacteria bacterium PR.023]|nr:histidine phosphatase family protein [Cyanobacteria bacterium PR.023]
MKPKRIFIIRHGQSEGNANKKTYETIPDWKIPLTAKGELEARAAGLDFYNKIGHERFGVYYSPFLRTKQTWRNMAINIPGELIDFEKEDPRLREQEWGHLRRAEDTHRIDKEREDYGPFFFRLPDGESGADVYDRATGFLSTAYRDFAKPDFPSNVLIVSHGFTLRILIMRWLHLTVDEFHKLKNPPNCYMVELNLVGDHYRLVTPLKTEE